MFEPSFNLSPTAPVLLARSEPAYGRAMSVYRCAIICVTRSTSDTRDTFSPVTPLAWSVRLKVIRMVNTAWDRLDSVFMFVAATVRDLGAIHQHC